MSSEDVRRSLVPLKVVNIGLQFFYEELKRQDVDVVNVQWRPPVQLDDRLKGILEKI